MTVICCIGAPNVIGDSVAPKVGDLLRKNNVNAYVYGTLDAPITALNYKYYLALIQKMHPHDKVIAVDSALGEEKNIGEIKIVKSGVFPGRALSRGLAPLGEIGVLAQVGDKSKDPISQLREAPKERIEKLCEKCYNTILNIIDCISINERMKSALA